MNEEKGINTEGAEKRRTRRQRVGKKLWNKSGTSFQLQTGLWTSPVAAHSGGAYSGGMRGRPEPSEAAPYYFNYIDRISSDDIVGVIETQLKDALGSLRDISEEKSLHRYAPDKWTMREVLNHVSDVERIFQHRALWFARGFTDPLPSFDEKTAAAAAGANQISWARHVGEFENVRRGTLDLLRNLPAEAWTRSGIASEKPFTVRALAYIIAGHLAHHMAILKERYL